MELDLGRLDNMKFNVGQVVVTCGVNEKLMESKPFASFVAKSFVRHCNGDWGELCEEDKETNEYALKNGERLLSRYENGDLSIYIITEWDRSVTTILFPEEY